MLYWMLSFQYVLSTGTYGVAFLLPFYTHLLTFHSTYIHIESLLSNLYLISWPDLFTVILSVVLNCGTNLCLSHCIRIYHFFYFAVVCILRTIWWLYILAQDWISSLTRSAACMVNSLAVKLLLVNWILRHAHVATMAEHFGNQGWKACIVIWLGNLSCHMFRAVCLSLEEHLQGNPCIKIASVILGYVLNGALNTWCTSRTQSRGGWLALM